MTYRRARIVIRVIGTLAGLFGIGGLYVVMMTVEHQLSSGTCRLLPFLTFPLILNGYCVYVGYLVWVKFSPAVFRHVIVSLCLCLFSLLDRILFWEPFSNNPKSWHPLASVAYIIATYIASGVLNNGLSRLLFPKSPNTNQTGTD
jgi:hypothetical protein